MCLIPRGHTVDWATLAHELHDESVLPNAREEVDA
jgi:hypothetical protein